MMSDNDPTPTFIPSGLATSDYSRSRPIAGYKLKSVYPRSPLIGAAYRQRKAATATNTLATKANARLRYRSLRIRPGTSRRQPRP